MGGTRLGRVRNIAALLVLLATVVLCTVMVSEDSSAVSSGDVKNNGSTIGSYSFDNGVLSVSANSLGTYSGTLSLADFDQQSDVEYVEVRNFYNDITSLFPNDVYENLQGITYKGEVFTGTNYKGEWSYDLQSGLFHLKKSPSSTSSALYNYSSSSSAPFYYYYFRSVATEILVEGYKTGGSCVFGGFTSAEKFRATDWNGQNVDSGSGSGRYLLFGMTALKEIQFDSLTTINYYLFYYSNNDSLRTTVQTITMPELTRIDSQSFYSFSALTTFTAPKVTFVDSKAFEGCSNLTSITMPLLTSVGSKAFYNCNSLTTVSAGTLQSVESSGFANCSSLTSLSFPALKTLKSSAFSGCTSLKTFAAPLMVIMDGSAFYNCSSLESITFSQGGITIGDNAFYNCTALKYIDSEYVQSLGANAFYGCSSLRGSNTDNTKLVFTRLQSISNTSADYSPFRGCTNITHIEFPVLASIGPGLFKGNTGINTVVFSGVLPTLSAETFSGCTSLTNVTLSSSTITIGDSAFNGCTVLQTITIPDSVTTIGAYAFYRSGLTDIDTKNVTTIGDYAFYECRQLKTITFGDDLLSIGQYAFFNTVCLEDTVTFPKKLETIGAYAFYQSHIPEAVFEKDPFSSTRVTIGANAFEKCLALNSVDLGDRVAVIGNNAFYQCTSLITLKMSTRVTDVGKQAFSGCLTMNSSIIFPDTLASIGQEAFYNTGITGVTFHPDCPLEVIPVSAFQSCGSLTGSLTISNSVKTIGASAFRDCTSLNGVLTISKSVQKIDNYAFYRTRITGITVESDSVLTSVGAYAFANCSMLTGNLALPASLETIGNYAFASDSNNAADYLRITGLSFGTNSRLETIGQYAFRNCTILEGQITFPKSLREIGINAFINCSKIGSISFEEDSVLEVIRTGAFYGCSKIDCDIQFPSGLKNIESEAFRDCTNIKKVTFGDSLTSIDNYAFYNCTSLTGSADGGILVIPDTVKTIGYYTFYNCGMKGAQFGSDSQLTTIGGYAFSYCSNIVSVVSSTTGGGVTLGQSAFESCSKMTVFNMPNVTALSFSYYYYHPLRGCTALETVIMPSLTDLKGSSNGYQMTFNSYTNLKYVDIRSVTTIPASMFSGCTALETVIIDSATVIGDNAFNGCTSFAGSNGTLSLPLVTSIGNYAFDNTSVTTFEFGPDLASLGIRALYNENLETITLDANNVKFKVQDGILFNYSMDRIIICPPKNPLTSFTVPDTVSVIDNYAFQYNKNIQSITFQSVLSLNIGQYAFQYCDALRTVVFPTSGALTIGQYAFRNSGISGAITIPESSTVDGYAFSNCTGITSVEIQSYDADSLAANAFSGCTGIRSLKVPVSVKLSNVFPQGCITSYTFTGRQSGLQSNYYNNNYWNMPWYGNYNIEITVTFEEGVTHIDNHMFYPYYSSYSRIVSVTLPDSVTDIGTRAFYNCSRMTTLVLSKNLTNVGSEAFRYCTAIQDLTIPINVSSKFNVFPTGIRSITFTEGATPGGYAYTQSDTSAMIWYSSSNYSVTFEDGITSISPFMCLKAAGSVSIPSSVRSIGEKAFYGSQMTSLSIADGLESIGDKAFGECTRLQTLVLPNTLVNFSGSPFYGCTSLIKVWLPITVDYSSPLFNGCTALGEFVFTCGTNGMGVDYTAEKAAQTPWYGICGTRDFTVTFGDGVNYVGEYMFYNCVRSGISGDRGLKCMLQFPDTLSSIGAHAFEGSTRIEGAVFGDSISTIGTEAFKGCEGITTLVIREAIQSIGGGAFSGCTGIRSLTIPLSLNTVGNKDNPIFNGCTGVTSFTFTGRNGFSYSLESSSSYYQLTPWYMSRGNTLTISFADTLESVGDYTFKGCTGISGTLTIPVSVTSVGTEAFAECTSISGLSITSDISLGRSAFKGCTGIRSLTFPLTSNTVCYSDAPAFEGCTGLTTLILVGTGAGYDYFDSQSNSDYRLTPWYLSRNNGMTVTFADTLTAVGSNTFRDCSGLTGNVVLGNNIKKVGAYAFDGTGITALTISDESVNLGRSAFRNCSSLTSLSIPLSVNTVGYADAPIFEGCVNLRNLAFTGSGAGFDYTDAASSSYYKLTPWHTAVGSFTVSFENTIPSIGTFAFAGCKGLDGVIDAADIKSVAANAFSGCTSLDGFDAPLLNSTGTNAFSGCTSIRSVNMPLLPEVPAYAFSGCTELSDATLSVCTSIGEHAFEDSGIKRINSDSQVDLSNVTYIGNYAFARSGVTKITIGKEGSNIQTFGDYVLLDCSDLTEVHINGILATLPTNTFRSSESTFSSQLRILRANRVTTFAASLADCFRYLEEVSITGTAYLDIYNVGMFRNCENLTTVNLPDSALILPGSAFEGCRSLPYINLENVTLSEGREFYSCINLNNIVLSSAKVPAYTFYGCTGLTVISAPYVTSLEQYAFSKSGLTSVNSTMFPRLTQVGNNAFEGCGSLLSVDLNINTLGKYVFKDCTALSSVTLEKITELNTGSFYGCSGLTDVSLDGVKSIRELAFYGCRNLEILSMNSVETVGDINMSSTVTINDYVEKAVFYECVKLRTISMPAIKKVGILAFYGCSNLTSFNGSSELILSDVDMIRFGAFAFTGFKEITVGKSGGITEIGDYAFYGCSRLEVFRSPSLTSLPEHLFNTTDVSTQSQVNSLTTIDVPKVVTFGASLHGCEYLQTVIATSATTFYDGAFYGCINLNSVQLSTTSTVVLSSRMFYGCERLVSINTDNVRFADSAVGETFMNCSSLTTMSFPSALSIPNAAFKGCTGLQSILAVNVTSVGSEAFSGCVSLHTVDVPKATVIHERAFLSCASLSKFNGSLGDLPFLHITEVREEAFKDCALTSLILSPNIRVLGARAFAGNPITEVVIPNSPVNNLILSAGLFQGCPLKEVHLSSSVTKIEASAFDMTGSSQNNVSFWFNGPVTVNLLLGGAIRCADGMSLTLYADLDSGSIVSVLESQGSIVNAQSVDYIRCHSTNIQFQTEEEGTPVFTNIRAIYGGKIVLPFISYGSGNYSVCKFATLDSKSNYLSIFASESDFTTKRVAESGMAVPVYPLDDDDSMVFAGVNINNYLGRFIDEMIITTESYGVAVDMVQQSIHYGSVIQMPSFYNSLMQVKGLSISRMDEVVYRLPTDTVQIRAGYYFETIIISSEDTKINVTFISKGETVVVEVTIQAPFEIPQNLKYMEIPGPGYTFAGWWTSEGGKGIRANTDTKFSIGQRWYAYFAPQEFTVNIHSDEPEWSSSFTVTGPYTLHVISGSLYYTDAKNTTNMLAFDASSIPGWSVYMFEDRNNFGRVISGDYAAVGDLTIDLYMTMNKYTILLKFTHDGNEIDASQKFRIDGWTVGSTNMYSTGDRVRDIPYSDIENGLVMPQPVHNVYAFGLMKAGNSALQLSSGRYVLALSDFDGESEVVIEYVMQMGVYTIQFSIGDDDSTTYTNAESITVGQFFVMPSVVRNYAKTGYVYDHIEIHGISGRYAERDRVELTDEMISHSADCVVKVFVVWVKVPYTIEFVLDPYQGTVSTIDGMTVDGRITLPTVTGYTGHRITGWHWSKGGSVSESFNNSVILTQEAVRGYADNGVIRIHAEWTAKTYTLEVESSYGYKFDVRTGTYGKPVTLWANTYSRSFMTFAGWSIGDTLYADSATVILDDIMAARGDASGDKIVFEMRWNKNEYQIQYNLDGGEGQIPADDKAYVVGETALTLAGASDSFYRNGYTFVGWKYSRDSYIVYNNTTGLFEPILAQYADANNIVTMYAVWSQKSYKISYNLDGGRAGQYAPTNVLYGDEITISRPTRGGFDFIGWTAENLTDGALYNSTSGYRGWNGTKMVTAGSFMDLCNIDEGNVVLTAHWEQATYLITYDLNGGSGIAIGTQMEIKIGDRIVLPTLRDGFKTGCTYAGWGVDPANAIRSGTVFSENMAPVGDNTLVLYAIWDSVEYKVRYRYTSDYDYSTLSVSYGEVINIPELYRAGYTFKGWSISNADSTTAYYSKDGNTWYRVGSSNIDGTYFKNLSSSNDGTVTLEALWEKKEYRIVYNTNGGTGKAPLDSKVYAIGDPIEMKDFYSLNGTNGSKSVVGWSLESNGSSVSIVEFTEGLSEKADATNAVNLYAVWVEGYCTVTVNLDGCTPSSVPSGWVQVSDGVFSKLVEYGVSTKDVMADWEGVTLSKDGHSFAHWKYDSATVTSATSVSPHFETVDMNILYVFIGIIGVLAVTAVVIMRKR